MSYSAKQYFAYEQRRLEPDSVIITGTRRRYHEVKRNIVIRNPSSDTRSEEQVRQMEDEFLASHGVPTEPKTY